MRRGVGLMSWWLTLSVTPAVAAQAPAAPPIAAIADRVAGLTHIDGYLPLYWDETQGACCSKSPDSD